MEIRREHGTRPGANPRPVSAPCASPLASSASCRWTTAHPLPDGRTCLDSPRARASHTLETSRVSACPGTGATRRRPAPRRRAPLAPRRRWARKQCCFLFPPGAGREQRKRSFPRNWFSARGGSPLLLPAKAAAHLAHLRAEAARPQSVYTCGSSGSGTHPHIFIPPQWRCLSLSLAAALQRVRLSVRLSDPLPGPGRPLPPCAPRPHSPPRR